MMTASKTAFASLGLLCGLGLLITACPASLDDHCAEGACVAATSPGEGGLDAASGDGGPDASVDPCVEKPTDPACLDENTALFVSAPNGNNADATGATGKPFKTIGAALAKITAAKRRIYICDGTYAEDLALTAAHNGVSLFGGIDCTFKLVSTNKPVIGASANPVKIDGTTGLAIADVAVEAKDATAGSSIAVFVNGGNVTLKRVRLVAGKGATAAASVLVPFTFPNQMALDGNPATDGVAGKKGGAAKVATCPGGQTSKGGAGGDPGAPGLAGEPNLGGGAGGTLTDCEINSAGGKKGTAGMNPGNAPGATTAGELQSAGWVASAGIAGPNGGPGQGGGGGAGYLGAGGSGGTGGCGGAGGPAGQGGGSSIALAAHQAKVSFVDSELQVKSGGDGGAGALGQLGQTEYGIGGNRNGSACNGGNGGIGGTGAAGGGGAGGSSIAVAYRGTKPEIDALTAGKVVLGTKGAGGQLPATSPGAPGIETALFESK
jgi:hypothetical protein